jgi:hypothetical protein
VSEVGGSGHIGFVSSGYHRKTRDNWCQKSHSHKHVTKLLDPIEVHHWIVIYVTDNHDPYDREISIMKQVMAK